MRSANNADIKFMGAMLLHLSGTDTFGRTFSSKQMTYITNRPGMFILSRRACADLGIISETFLTIGEALSTWPSTQQPRAHPQTMYPDGRNRSKDDTMVDACHQSEAPSVTFTHSQPKLCTRQQPHELAPCGCPKCTDPPSLPKLPFPATKQNRERLENFILDYWSSSTFNICPHQPPPYMSGPPMKLMVDPNAKPVANFKTIPVPIHYEEDVKADRDMDVRLRKIRKVPPNTPVKWCHSMVVTAKKDNKPRRTVDFQALNKHASREVHQTPSPFHLARSVPHNMKKSTLDCWHGYHSVWLLECDYEYTTFKTQWGLYQYMVAPQGYIASGDAFTSRYDTIIANV